MGFAKLYTVLGKVEDEQVHLRIEFEQGLEDYLDLESEELDEIVQRVRSATADLLEYITRGE
jgi:hypothetical protein